MCSPAEKLNFPSWAPLAKVDSPAVREKCHEVTKGDGLRQRLSVGLRIENSNPSLHANVQYFLHFYTQNGRPMVAPTHNFINFIVGANCVRPPKSHKSLVKICWKHFLQRSENATKINGTLGTTSPTQPTKALQKNEFFEFFLAFYCLVFSFSF